MTRAASILMMSLRKIIPITLSIALASFLLSAGCTNLEKQGNKTLIPETTGSKGYLPMEALPNSIALLPPPPAEGSLAYELDKEASRNSFSFRGSPSWQLASEYYTSLIPKQINAFFCSLHVSITEQQTPNLYALLRRTYDDIGFADNAAKYNYNRPRPFVVNNEPKCNRANMHKHTSYPSGTAALYWAWALILSEIAPDKSDDMLARGRALGQLGVMCNVDWLSDVSEGRLLGSIVVARLHAEPEFQAVLEAAKSELTSVEAKGLSPIRDCAAEDAALFQGSMATF